MKEKKTQRGEVLRWLKTHKKGLTSLEAIERFGCTRLAAVIAHFERKGMAFEHKNERVKDRYGRSVMVTRYIYTGGE